MNSHQLQTIRMSPKFLPQVKVYSRKIAATFFGLVLITSSINQTAFAADDEFVGPLPESSSSSEGGIWDTVSTTGGNVITGGVLGAGAGAAVGAIGGAISGGGRGAAQGAQNGAIAGGIAGALGGLAGSVGGGNGSGSGTATNITVDDSVLRSSICALFHLIEGSFGGLIMTVAGIGAVVGAAFGMYRAGYSLLIVGIGAFILRSLVSLWFGTFGCGSGLEIFSVGYDSNTGGSCGGLLGVVCEVAGGIFGGSS